MTGIALILTSNFENFREFPENPQKFSKLLFLRAAGIGGQLSTTTSPYLAIQGGTKASPYFHQFLPTELLKVPPQK